MAQMICKMGCHRRLCYARLLNRSGFGFVTVFVPAYVSRFPHYSALSLKKAFPSASIQFSHFRTPTTRAFAFSFLNTSRTCFPICFMPFSHSVTVHFLNRISNPHSPLVSLLTTFTQAPFNQPQVFPAQSNANKNMRQTFVHTAEVAGCPVPCLLS